MVPNAVESARNWLKTRHINVPDDWVEACIEWICEENQDGQQTQSQINNLVYEQWLLADLHEIQSKCLPDAVKDASKFHLTGTYALQIDSLINVGQPYYTQLQKLKGTENANALVSGDHPAQKPWEPKPTRMLMMKLTDGTIDVQGMEYKTISNLNPQIKPGTKIMVQGSVMCRHGVLMLTGNNVQVLGGEVDTLMESNTQEKILQEALESEKVNAGKECKQEFDGGPVQRDQKRLPAANVQHQKSTQNKPNISSMPIQHGNQINSARNRNNDREIKQESEWEDDFVLHELMDDMDEFEMNQPVTWTSNTNKNSVTNTRQIGQDKSQYKSNQFQPRNQINDQPNQQKFGTGNQSSLPVKKETDCEMNSIDLYSSSVAVGATKKMATERHRSDLPVKSEIEIEKSFSANLKSRSFSSSTPLKPFEKTVLMGQKNVSSIKNSPTVFDQKTITGSVHKNMDLGDFEDDLDDFDLATVDTSIPVSNINQNPVIASPPVDLATVDTSIPVSNINQNPVIASPPVDLTTVDTSIPVSNINQNPVIASPPVARNVRNSDSSNFINDNSSRNLVCQLVGNRDIPIQQDTLSDSSSNVVKSNSLSNVKKSGGSKTVSNTMDKYLTSPSCSGKQHGSFNSSTSPSFKRSMIDDDQLEKFNKIKSSRTHLYQSSPVNLHTEPFTYLSVVSKHLPVKESFTFKVKAYVSTLIGRLECPKGDRWTLSCKINDGTSTMDVDLSNQVLTILIGFSGKDSIEMRKRIKHDPGIRDVLAEGLQQCQQKLIELSCIMEIEVNPGQERPVVTSLISVTSSHISELHNRVSNYLNKVT